MTTRWSASRAVSLGQFCLPFRFNRFHQIGPHYLDNSNPALNEIDNFGFTTPQDLKSYNQIPQAVGLYELPPYPALHDPSLHSLSLCTPPPPPQNSFTSTDSLVALSDSAPNFVQISRREFVCLLNGCNKHFTRISDLRRHHLSVHRKTSAFFCRFPLCNRAIRGFPRKDKRNDHEEKIHRREVLVPVSAPLLKLFKSGTDSLAFPRASSTITPHLSWTMCRVPIQQLSSVALLSMLSVLVTDPWASLSLYW